jgi:hypothetical protein
MGSRSLVTVSVAIYVARINWTTVAAMMSSNSTTRAIDVPVRTGSPFVHLDSHREW